MEQVKFIEAGGVDSGETLAKKINEWEAQNPTLEITQRIIIPIQGYSGLSAFIFYKVPVK